LAKKATELTLYHIYDYAIFEQLIHAFDTQSGCRDAFERQRAYTRRDLLMGKLNPEKFSQRLQEMNRYLDFIPMEKIQEKKDLVQDPAQALVPSPAPSMTSHLDTDHHVDVLSQVM
jgi:hypothetical protein